MLILSFLIIIAAPQEKNAGLVAELGELSQKVRLSPWGSHGGQQEVGAGELGSHSHLQQE